MQSFFCPLYDAHIVHQEQKDFAYGRIETRTMSSIVDPLSLDPDSTLDKWERLKSIHMMTRVRTDKKTDKSTSETTFYISSLTDEAEVFKLIREHWAVENKVMTVSRKSRPLRISLMALISLDLVEIYT